MPTAWCLNCGRVKHWPGKRGDSLHDRVCRGCATRGLARLPRPRRVEDENCADCGADLSGRPSYFLLDRFYCAECFERGRHGERRAAEQVGPGSELPQG